MKDRTEEQQMTFALLVLSALSGKLALLECKDAKTGEPITALCALGPKDLPLPIAKLFNGNPFEELIPAVIPESAPMQPASNVLN